jgi:hypothetical protein
MKRHLSGLCAIEEAGCQARDYSLQVKELLGFVPWVPSYIYKAIRLHVWLVFETLEGKWGSRRIVEQRRGTLPGVGQACGE